MPEWEFPGSDPIDVSADLASGRVALAAGPVSATTVTVVPSRFSRNSERLISEVRVAFDHGRLEIAGPKRAGLFRGSAGFDVTVTLPEGSRCVAHTASADVTCTGDLAELDAQTASGNVTAAIVTGRLQAVTSSGDVRVDDTGPAEIRTASGDVRLTRARGDVSVRTASGDVSVASAAASVNTITASGDVRLAQVARGSAQVSTASGDVVVGVAAGVGVYLDLASTTGSVTSRLDEAEPSGDVPLEVTCRTVSGDIRVIRAAAAGPPAPAGAPPPARGPPPRPDPPPPPPATQGKDTRR
jgi:DUF4097 and DUF4098 domain-containing protein YvlB